MKSLRIIEIRQYRGGWQAFEHSGLSPYWKGQKAKEMAMAHAKKQLAWQKGEIRILDQTGEIEGIIHTSRSSPPA